MIDRAAIQSYKDLDVWQVAMDLAATCYKATAALLRDEIYGMTAQIRRASVSIAANIGKATGVKRAPRSWNSSESLRAHSRSSRHI